MCAAGGAATDGSDALTGAVATSVARLGSAMVLSVSGPIDLLTVPALDAAIADALTDKPAVFVVDLCAVTFLGIAGLRTLLLTHEALVGTGHFAVVADGPVAARPIELTGLNEVFGLYRSVDDALSALG